MAKKRSGATQQNSDVRYSDRGYIYAEEGRSGRTLGVVAFGSLVSRLSLSQVPQGILFYNTDTGTLQISDPDNSRWIDIYSGTDFAKLLGLPTDGSFLDGVLALNPSGTIADAIDSLNEYLVGCCGSGITTYASHLGTTDGSTNGYLQEPSYTVGRVAAPTYSGSPYHTNGWDNDTNRDLLNTNPGYIELLSGEEITDLQSGTISVSYTDGSGTAVHTEQLALDGTLNNQTSTPSGYCTVSGLGVFGSRIEGKLGLSIPSTTILNNQSGYLKTNITHNINATDYSQEFEFFLDRGDSPSATFDSVALSNTVVKYLSGVKFATISGSNKSSITFVVSASGAWKDTYRADLLTINSNSLGIPNFLVNYNSTEASKNGSSPPAVPFIYNQDFVFSGSRDITVSGVTNPPANGTFLTIDTTVRDPFTSSTSSGYDPHILINTYGDVSTDVLELFQDEDYRLIENSGVGPLSAINSTGRGALLWDSTQSLNTVSGLQVVNGVLKYPQDDWSGYAPLPNPDYSSLPSGASSLVYIRRFRDSNGASRSNGVFKLDGLTDTARTSGNVLIDIRVVGTHIPGSGIQGIGNEGTGWLSLNTPYNIATFLGDDGDGCFVTTNGYTEPYFEFTLGGFSTAYAANQAIEVRVTYNNPQALSTKITRAEIINWD